MFALILTAHAGEKAGTILIHPGEVVYARFEAKGKKIKLASATKVKDDGAQVIFTLLPDEKKGGYSLKVENKFSKDLRYRAEMRSLSKKMKFNVSMTPVVAGKLALESFPKEVEEVAAYEFQLEK
jgi:hypothetical protein